MSEFVLVQVVQRVLLLEIVEAFEDSSLCIRQIIVYQRLHGIAGVLKKPLIRPFGGPHENEGFKEGNSRGFAAAGGEAGVR